VIDDPCSHSGCRLFCSHSKQADRDFEKKRMWPHPARLNLTIRRPKGAKAGLGAWPVWESRAGGKGVAGEAGQGTDKGPVRETIGWLSEDYRRTIEGPSQTVSSPLIKSYLRSSRRKEAQIVRETRHNQSLLTSAATI
jgi:hypothetical protein